MPKRIDVASTLTEIGTRYPEPFDLLCRPRMRKRLGDAAGLTQFGMNLIRLPPGAWSSQRHRHTNTDEFMYVIEGELALVTDDGVELLVPGDLRFDRAPGAESFGYLMLYPQLLSGDSDQGFGP
jgi:uncharacterized cupin superfamily protein